MDFEKFYEIVIFVNSGYKFDGHSLSNQSISDYIQGWYLAKYRLGKVVSAWRVNAISKWC
jgi:hypothetical protein